MTTLDGTYTYGKGAGGRFSAFVFLIPPDPNGLWGMHNMSVWVPMSLIGKDAATAQARSLEREDQLRRRGNTERNDPRNVSPEVRDRSRELGGGNQARTERVDEAMAQDRIAQEGMHKQAVAMENYSLDRAVIVDTRTGDHATVGSDFADTLARDNPNFQKVPTQDLLRGVDY